MAGSFVHHPQHDDPILASRVEALKVLADRLVEPVIILDPSLKLIYANSSADIVSGNCPILERAKTEGLTPAPDHFQPCEHCPGKKALTVGEAMAQPCSAHSSDSGSSSIPQNFCPFPFATPLTGEQGEIGCVLMMGTTGKSSVMWNVDEPAPFSSEHSSGDDRKESLDLLIGQSPAMQQLSEMVQLVAASEATVLVQGESGTGKELVAKTIHRLSKRRNNPFVVVDCSSLPETLLESELFGHVRGAFTGAVASRKGLFEEAEGGTVFLDEIADTSPTFQAKLLRVLQEGEIKPIGCNQSTKVDVRVISASNKGLLDLLEAKAFRADLYYRLAVLPLSIPPLRDRREDIPLLVRYFIDQACHRHGKTDFDIHPEAMEALMGASWPGNVRELENLIERAIVTTAGSSITVDRVIPHIFSPTTHESQDLFSVSKTAREEAERNSILEALRKTAGNKTKAARLLKISRAGLYNKIQAYNLVVKEP